MLKFNEWLANELPPEEYAPENEPISRVAKAFGFYSVLDNVARYVGSDDQEVERWSVNKFYTKVRYLAWMAHADRERREILKDRKNSV